jgi:long-chain acyl-CoA synthetase
VALANPLDGNARPGTIGLALPGTDLRIADLVDPTRDVPVDVPGELCVRGPQVFAGYWRQPEETASMLRDGWLHTGDIAMMDEDGFVTIVDRKRDVILASGFSIFPSEIEDVLAEHPAVEECAVVGVPHFYRGETVKAYVVVRAGCEDVSEDELRRFCAHRLVAYKVPAQVEFRPDLPRNLIGKVLRRVLRAEHEAVRAAAVGPHRGSGPDPGPAPVEPPPAPRHAVPDEAEPPEWGLAARSGLVDELERLVRLRDAGALTNDEFGAAKARLLR